MKVILTAFLAVFFATAWGPLPATAGGTAPPVYPGAVASARPAGVGLKAPPANAKTYVTSDDFAKVKAWYKAHLKGAQEMAQPGMEKTEDAFLVGSGASGMVVMVQSYKGKTWIIIGPPM
ncbi:MAG TPA: hypothetical protein VFE35_01550 [Candidatus Cybelea sp.]|jgi:hypothetical protein|nr:hypothetical protein [Candidatus Cybelea sp.]